MEETSNLKRRRQTLAKAQSLNAPTTTTASTNDRRRRRGGNSSAVEAYNTEEHRDENADGSMEENNSEMWNDFSDRFRQVQSVLDRNRLLIQQVNENHHARTHNNMVQNVGLIQELKATFPRSFLFILIYPPIFPPCFIRETMPLEMRTTTTRDTYEASLNFLFPNLP